ncbi:MAG: hypothetical protein ACFE9Q_02445 [Candidatus Hodarchaeota archaeon]
MESNLQILSAFQMYSTGTEDKINVMIDRLWVKANQLFFRVVEINPLNKRNFRRKQGVNVFSTKREDLLNIRCRLYF